MAGMTSLMKQYAEGEEIELAAQVRVPTLIPWGDQDRNKPRSEADDAAAPDTGRGAGAIRQRRSLRARGSRRRGRGGDRSLARAHPPRDGPARSLRPPRRSHQRSNRSRWRDAARNSLRASTAGPDDRRATGDAIVITDRQQRLACFDSFYPKGCASPRCRRWRATRRCDVPARGGGRCGAAVFGLNDEVVRARAASGSPRMPAPLMIQSALAASRAARPRAHPASRSPTARSGSRSRPRRASSRVPARPSLCARPPWGHS